jgi:MFS family permease
MAAFVVSSVLIGLTLLANYTDCIASAGDYVPVHFAGSAFGLMSTGASLGLTLSPRPGQTDGRYHRDELGLLHGAGGFGCRHGWRRSVA